MLIVNWYNWKKRVHATILYNSQKSKLLLIPWLREFNKICTAYSIVQFIYYPDIFPNILITINAGIMPVDQFVEKAIS